MHGGLARSRELSYFRDRRISRAIKSAPTSDFRKTWRFNAFDARLVVALAEIARSLARSNRETDRKTPSSLAFRLDHDDVHIASPILERYFRPAGDSIRKRERAWPRIYARRHGIRERAEPTAG